MNNKELEILSQQVQTLHVKIELLDKNEYVVEEIQGLCVSGSIDISSSSIIRNTCNITMYLADNSYLPLPNNKIWMDKKFRLWVGIEDILNKEISWFNKGVYYFDKPSVNLDQDNKTLSFTGLDKMCWMDGTYGGTLGYVTKISANTPVFDAVKNLLSIIGETKFIINDVDILYVPMDMEESESSSIADFLTKIRDLYMGFEFYYNNDGYFVYQKIKDRKNDNVEWVFGEDSKVVVNYSNSPDWSNIKNRILVWGRQKEDAEQISYELKNVNDNVFGIDSIGEKLMVVSEDTIQLKSQAISRAEYELWLHSSLNESVSIDCIAIYGLDVNKLVTINKSDVGISGNYRITDISYNLNDGIMNFNCVKMYY